jgi:hypothetical protein
MDRPYMTESPCAPQGDTNCGLASLGACLIRIAEAAATLQTDELASATSAIAAQAHRAIATDDRPEARP